MIVGGWESASIHKHFARLAGVPEADVVCVPTALPHGRWSGWCRQFFRQAEVPADHRTVLHTRTPETADRKSFVELLKTADAVWFTGGRQWRLVQAYGGTRTEDAFHAVLERGGVIGGSSAGASIQGSFLLRGDPSSKKIVVGKYTEGFGFLPHSVIDQHVVARKRERDLIEVIEERPGLLGIGVDENTAAIVRGDTLTVVGESVVTIYDARRWEEADPGVSPDDQYFFLHPGEQFNLQSRRTISNSESGN